MVLSHLRLFARDGIWTFGPKNDVISFSRKGICALGFELGLGLE